MSDKNLRFTSHVQRAFDLAQEEADKQGLNEINPEHLLLGLMREETGTAGQFLRELGLGAKEVQEFVSREPPFRRDAMIGLIVLDTNGNVTYRNPAAQAIIDKHGAGLHNALSGLSPEGETEIDIDDQSYLTTTSPEPGERTIVILQGIAYVGKAQEKAQRQLEELAIALRYDLRSPVTVIKGLAELILRVAPQDGKERQFAQHIIKATSSMIEMIDQMLVLMRAEVPEKVDFKPCDLKAVVDRAVVVLQDSANSKSIRVHFDFPTETCAVSGHEEWLYTMVLNLLSNAIKFSPNNKEVAIELSRTATEIRLCVRDQGRGLSQDEIQQLFKRYFRGNDERENQRSTSLGLPIVKAIVDRHGGTITVNSTPGISTEFIVVLPALKQEDAL